mmetsp:Transcript_33066/g.71979  ORF Transcript_33066/g.71979 Transcript_33066/m.71979 type:complete len:514 (-) Transcript_33066:93-1634(-)
MALAEPAMGYFDLGVRPFGLPFPPCVANLARRRSVWAEEASLSNSVKMWQREPGATFWERQDSCYSQVSTTASITDLSSWRDVAPGASENADSGSQDNCIRRPSFDSDATVHGERQLVGMTRSAKSKDKFLSQMGYGYDAVTPADHAVGGVVHSPGYRAMGDVKEDARRQWKRQTSMNSQLSMNSQISTEMEASTLGDFLSKGSSIDVAKESEARMERRSKEVMMAAKRMPNEWVRGSHEEFMEAHPEETECPWTDIGCVQFLNDINYPYACQLYGVYRDSVNTYVLSSFASEGDLLAWACKQPQAPGMAREALMRPLLAQVARALRQLHLLSIVHRDISVENILIDQDSDGSLAVKLIDFGASSTERFHNLLAGKLPYISPEQHPGKAYDAYLADAFALGVVVYVALLKDYPWKSTAPGECKCFNYIQKHGFRAFLAKRKLPNSKDRVAQALSDEALELLEGLLTFNPADRLHLGDDQVRSLKSRSICDLPWFQEDFVPKGPSSWHGMPMRD